MKIRSIGAELFHADGETHMTKLTKSLLSFANAPKNVHSAHTVFVRFVFTSEGTATYAVYRRIGFTGEIKSIFCGVRTGYLTKTVYHLSLNGSVTIFNLWLWDSEENAAYVWNFHEKCLKLYEKQLQLHLNFQKPQLRVSALFAGLVRNNKQK